MADILKLKKKAADFEAKKQMDKALAVYREMIEVYESGEEDPIDIPLYNRVGDLLQRAGNLPEAVAVWERAVDHYAEGGFYNPAIALCNKILRQSPGRAIVYYKLGRISAEKGFRADARSNFLEYASRMQKAGNLDEAFRALKEFADLVPDQDDVRLMLADQLLKAERKTEAIAQLQLVYSQLVSSGRGEDAEGIVAKMKAIDPAVEPNAEASSGGAKGADLVFLDLDSGPPGRRSTRAMRTPPVEGKRATKATEGLELLDVGGDEAPAAAPAPAAQVPPPPAAPPAAPARPATPPAQPTQPAAGATPASTELVIEPTHVGGDEVPPTGKLAGLETTTLGFDLEPGALAEGMESILTPPPAAPDVPLIDLEPTATPADLRAVTADVPLIDLEPTAIGTPTGTPGVEREAAAPAGPPPDESRPARETPVESEVVVEASAPEAPPVEPPTEPPAESVAEPPRPALAEHEVSIAEGVAPFAAPEPPKVEEPPPETMFLDMETSDFGSFGEVEPFAPRPSQVPEGFEVLEIESSEGVHALPLDEDADAGTDDAGLHLLEVAPEPQPAAKAAPAPVEEAPDPALAAAAAAFEMPDHDRGDGEPGDRRTSAVLAHSVDTLRERVEAMPEDPGLRRQYAEALLDDGQREAGIAELELALAGYEQTGDLDTAASISEEIVRLAPKVIRFHQKRVEFAFRANDRRRLAEAYVELADALLGDGQAAKARVVYQRVLDIAPDDLRAQAALETIADAPVPEPTPAPRRSTVAARHSAAAARPQAKPSRRDADDDFVSLGDLVRDDDAPKSTRLVVAEQEPTGDEQADFADMLRKFKQGIAENVEEEDHAAHYDLGIAYKEMGLLDEAIGEFQKALRGTTERARTFEALGHCFVEKGQLPVAATILSRALNEPVGDEALIGVLYLLGAISEELGLDADAKRYYQRVFAVDIGFRDVGERLNTVEQRLQ